MFISFPKLSIVLAALITLPNIVYGASASPTMYSIFAAHAEQHSIADCKAQSSCKYNHVHQTLLNESLTQVVNEDLIPDSNRLSELLVQGEYQLLVGATQFGNDSNNTSTQTLKLEFSLDWRGIPIFQTDIQSPVSELQSTIKVALIKLGKKIQQVDALSPAFLFTQLEASDYEKDFFLPEKAKDFYLTQSELQANPTLGKLSRYQHKQFPNAIIDVYVYPTMDSDYIQTPALVMQSELERDHGLFKLQGQTEEFKSMKVSDISGYQLPSPDNQTHSKSALMFTASADDGLDTLFTTQVIFLLQDKYVKFTANIPKEFVEPMMKKVMSEISVPEPSNIMKAFRELNKEYKQQNASVELRGLATSS